MKHKIFKSSDTNVSKFVFEGDDIEHHFKVIGNTFDNKELKESEE